MIARALWNIVLFCILSLGVGILGVTITFIFQGSDMALALFESYFLKFNGIFVGGFGYGLLFYLRSTEQQGFNSLLNLLEIDDENLIILHRYNIWVSDYKRKNLIAMIVTLLGGAILWNCGYPLSGFAKYFLAITSISMFYVAGLMSGYFFSSMLIFRKLDEICKRISLKKAASSFELENLNISFIISSTIAVFALYIAFRGTLTANFVSIENNIVFHKFLIYPVIIFLPGILFTSFYYRYVLKKIKDNETIKKIERIEAISIAEISKISNAKEKLEMEKLLIEIKEKLILETKKSPILSLKDSPALAVALVLLLQFIIQNDKQVQLFINSLFK